MSCGCAARREKIDTALRRSLKAAAEIGENAVRMFGVLGGKPEATEEENAPKK